jgi:transposase
MGNKINIQETIENARKQIADEPNLSPALKATFELLVNLCLLLARKWLPNNSTNSNTPPSADPNREKSSKAKGNRKPGGQEGHPGVRLEPVEKADKVILLKIDRRTLPPGEWKSGGWEKRQVIDMEITRAVTEYRAEILVNEKGETKTAEFPAGLVQAAQYGEGVKAHAVYMSAQQLIPCERVSDHFTGQMGIPLSAGSACNFKEEAYNKLEGLVGGVKERLKGEAGMAA